MRRRQEEQELAMRTAEAQLAAQLRGDLTAVLLASGMALADGECPRKSSLDKAAARMQNRLRRA